MAFSMKSGPVGCAQPMAEINVIPLVDVMLVLLVIFIITAPLMTQAVPVQLPRAEGVPIDERPKTVRVSLDEHQQLYFNGEPVGYETLQELLANLASEPGPMPSLELHAWRGARYEHVVHLMASARQVGITNIGFVTEGASPDLRWTNGEI